MNQNWIRMSQWVLAGAIGLFLWAGGAASAAVVYQENFDDGAADGWASAGSAGTYTYTVSGGVLQGVDTSSSGWSTHYVNQNSFDSFSTGELGSEIVELSFDLRVDDYSAVADSAQTFRLMFQPQTSSVRYSMGLGYGAVNGVDKLFLCALSEGEALSVSDAIGYDSESETWTDGFELGSSVSNGTGGVFFRFTLVSDSITGDMQITVENLTTGDTASFSDSWTPYVMDTSIGGCALWLITGTDSTGTVLLDNVTLSVSAKPVQAVQSVFEDDFEDDGLGDWMKAGNTGTLAVSNGVLQCVDNATDGWNIGYVTSSSFSLFSTTNENRELVELCFDMRLDNYSVPLSNSGTFRVLFQPYDTSLRYAIGLGFATINSEEKVFLFGGTGSTPIPSASNAIGYNAESESWDAGFDLGSSVSNGTGGVFFRFTIASCSTSGKICMRVENLSTGDTTSYSDSMDPYVMDSSLGGSLWVATGSVATGSVLIDNVQLSALAVNTPGTASYQMNGGSFSGDADQLSPLATYLFQTTTDLTANAWSNVFEVTGSFSTNWSFAAQADAARFYRFGLSD